MNVLFPARYSSGFARGEGEKILFEIGVAGEGGTTTSPLGRSDVKVFLEEMGILAGYEGEIADHIFAGAGPGHSAPSLMAVVNATPDSFFPGSRIGSNLTRDVDLILDQRPDIIDVGGESTRPGSTRIAPEEEIRRIKPVVEYISESSSIPISIDTRNPETAERMLAYRYAFLNDVSGFSDHGMTRIAVEHDLECVVMHMRGMPDTMQKDTEYVDVISEIIEFFFRRVSEMVEAGVKPGRIILDPGIGFGKNYDGNLKIIRNAHCFNLGFRTLFGTSRKSFLGTATGSIVDNRLGGTIATSVYLMKESIDILRVHDVSANRDALRVYSEIISH